MDGISSSADIPLPPGGYRRWKSFRLAVIFQAVILRFNQLYLKEDQAAADKMTELTALGLRRIASGAVVSAGSKRSAMEQLAGAKDAFSELRNMLKSCLLDHSVNAWTAQNPLFIAFEAHNIENNRDFRNFTDWALTRNQPGTYLRNWPLKAVVVANTAILLASRICDHLEYQISCLAADGENQYFF